ncbi:MAG: hypothetical protein ACTSPN_00495 [Promethearchaeota archaeon]
MLDKEIEENLIVALTTIKGFNDNKTENKAHFKNWMQKILGNIHL